MTSLTVNDTDGLVSRLQEQYSNLRVVGADVEKIFEGTGLHDLFSSRKWIMKASELQRKERKKNICGF